MSQKVAIGLRKPRMRCQAVATVVVMAAAVALSVGSTAALATGATHAGTKSPFRVALQRHFVVMARSRGRRTDDVNIPSTLTAAFSRAPGLASYGPDTAQAQAVAVNSSFTGWLVPAAKGVCLFATVPTNAGLPASVVGGYFATCDTTANATDGYSISAERIRTSGLVWQRVWGLAPNGDSTVTVAKSDGTSETVPVVDNMFVAYGDASAEITSVTVDSASGEPETSPISPR